MSQFQRYRKKGTAEMRPYVAGEDLGGISVSDADRAEVEAGGGGMVARNPENHADQWYVARAFVEKNYERVEE